MSKADKPDKAMEAMHKEYRAEDDLRTLVEAAKIMKHPENHPTVKAAAEIRKDKPRHKAAMAKHKEMMANLQAVAQQGAGPQGGDDGAGAGAGAPGQGAPGVQPSANGGAY